MDGSFDGVGEWGSPVAVGDQTAGWAGANAKNLYVVENGDYVYFGADITASPWMNWAFIISTKSGGGPDDSWARSINYNHTNKPDFVLRGNFGSYAQYHSWNGSSWDGVGTAIATTEFGENINSNDQNGWIECRILKSELNNATVGDIQFYITGDQNPHGTFDAVPDDENADSWDESGSYTSLDNYITGVDLGGVPIVTFNPTFPTVDQEITITFDATGTPLEGATSVYLHSGISTNETNPLSFNKTIGNWGQDDGIGQMTSTGTDIWQIIITDIYTVYGIDPDEDVFGFNYLFRNAAGSLKEDNAGENYYNAVDPESYFTIQSPSYSPYLAEVNIDFDINSTANVIPTQWELTEIDPVSEAFIATITTQSAGLTFSYTHNVNTTQLKKYKLIADFGSGNIKYKTFEILAHDPVSLLSRPAWTKLGINYHDADETKATLVLHAPTYTVYKDGLGNQTGTNTTAAKNIVYVIGDFNDWTPSETYKMNRDRDGWNGTTDSDADNDHGDYWWIELSDLVPGEEYVFQYLMEDNLQVADPYCNKISDFDDQYIDSDIYPNLPMYPSEAIDRASVLQTQQPEYIFTASDFSKPSNNNLNIYELHFRDFTEEGTYLAAIEKLDYIKGLGINAIHVMPVSEFEGNSSWGYNPNFYFAADKAYGKAEDLKLFIDECHKRKIQVFNDLVLNHAFYSNVMAKMYWNEADTKPANDNPWFNPDHKMVSDPAGWWGADWNHESVHTQSMIDNILDYWLQEFKFDGFRFDFTKGFGQTAQDSGDPWASSYDQARIDLLKRMVDGMWARNPGSVAIFEHLAWASEDKVLADHGVLLWSGQGHHNQVKNFVLGFDTDDPNLYDSGIYNSSNLNFNFANWMSYPESHDEERLSYELSQYFNGPKTTENIVNRMKLGLAFNMLFPGPRMLWEFEELAYDISIDFNGRTGEKPPKWEYYNNDKRKELYTLIQKLFKLRNKYPMYNATPDYGNIGTESGSIDIPRRMSLSDDNGHYAIVIGNLDPNNSHSVTPGYQVTGEWYKYNGDFNIDGTVVNVSTTSDTYSLNPSEVFLLTNFKIDDCTHVVNAKNNGYGSLREAIDCASSGDIIVFDYLVWNDTLSLTSPISIDKNITIIANGKNISIDGNNSTQLFIISNGNQLKLDGITLFCGNSVNGRCIENNGSLILENVTLKDENLGSGSSILNQMGGNVEVLQSVEIIE